MSKLRPQNEPIVFINNAGALGDCVATTPVIKYAIENIWANGKYRLMVNDYFKCLFPFVPEDKFLPMTKHSLVYGVFGDERYGWKMLNDSIVALDGHASGLISGEKMSLIDYASVKFLGKVLPESAKKYPKLNLENVDIDRFNLPEKYACIVSVTAHKIRRIPDEEQEKIVKWLIKNGITPVYVGKSEREVAVTQLGDTYGKTFVSKGINLIDKTSILECAKVMSKAVCVIGADTGLVHLAGMTDVPVLCGYTTVSPDVRAVDRVIPIVPEIDTCRFCQSDAYLYNNDFNLCPIQTNECAKDMRANKFIEQIYKLL